MVRVKHRYLLIHILYPEPSSSSAPQANALAPALVSFRRPTPSHVTDKRLLGTLRDQIELLYGDYGVGVTKASLAGGSRVRPDRSCPHER